MTIEAGIDLTPAERAAAQARRKKLYQQLHPETKSGGPGRGRPKNSLAKLAKLNETEPESTRAREQAIDTIPRGSEDGIETVSEPSPQPGVNPTPRYDEAAAKATGQSERAVRREVHQGEALGEDVLAKVARTSLDKGEELDALAKLPPDVEADAITRPEIQGGYGGFVSAPNWRFTGIWYHSWNCRARLKNLELSMENQDDARR